MTHTQNHQKTETKITMSLPKKAVPRSIAYAIVTRHFGHSVTISQVITNPVVTNPAITNEIIKETYAKPVRSAI